MVFQGGAPVTLAALERIGRLPGSLWENGGQLSPSVINTRMNNIRMEGGCQAHLGIRGRLGATLIKNQGEPL
jgi:hypothetical protein